MSSTSVITGATGHIGYALAMELVARGQRPRLLLRKPSPLFAGMPCDIAFGDITDPASLPAAFEGADTVYHLAGLIEVNEGNDDMVWRVNIDGTQNVVSACKASGVRRLVYCSSVDAMPPAPKGETMRETGHYASAAVSGAYAKSKAIATQAALNSAGGGFEAVACLPSACIGPYDFKCSNIGVMVRLFMRMHFPVTMRFGGYNFVDVRDAAQGLAACADPARAPSGESYLLTGEYLDTEAFIAALAELTGHRAPILPLPRIVAGAAAPAVEQYYKFFDKTPLFTSYSLRKIQENGLFSYEKAARALAYRPRSARESLEDMIQWIEKNDPEFVKYRGA